VDFYRSGKLEIGGLALRRYALDEINEAYDDLERGADGRGVIVFDGIN
jgi:S-(hydroxymethyl)glutathione dehydrogenase/alcohol dehydrogenase